jgi:hypothetical protein
MIQGAACAAEARVRWVAQMLTLQRPRIAAYFLLTAAVVSLALSVTKVIGSRGADLPTILARTWFFLGLILIAFGMLTPSPVRSRYFMTASAVIFVVGLVFEWRHFVVG